MTVKIEPASQADLNEIADLWHEGWHQAHAKIVAPALVASRQPAEFQARTQKHLPQTQVARVEGRIAGFFMLSEEELYQFYVSPAFRGGGLAATLMAAVERTLEGRIAWLACSVGNDRAARFYEKAGWRCVAEEEYDVETAQGSQPVTIWRYEKDLR